VRRDLQCLGDTQQFKIGNTSNLRLNLRQSSPADVPAKNPYSRAQFVLRQAELIPDLSNFWTNDILAGSHAQTADWLARSRKLLRFHSRLHLNPILPRSSIARSIMTQPCFIKAGTQEVFVLNIGATTIGRSPTCEIVVNDRKASSKHATVIRDSAGQFVIRDLGSTNGTFVNEKKTAASPLSTEDSIRIGAVTFVFHKGDALSPSLADESPQTIVSSTLSGALHVKAHPPLMEEILGLKSHIDVWSFLLATIPWFCSLALGAAGMNAAYFRVRAKAKNQPTPAWPLIALISLWLAWLILTGWGRSLVQGALLVGLCLILLKFYRDNNELWQNFDSKILHKAMLRTASFSGLIALLLLPGIGVGWAAHNLLEISFERFEKIPRASLVADLDEELPENPAPSMWHPQEYLAWRLDPWRLLIGKARDELSKSSLNEAPAGGEFSWTLQPTTKASPRTQRDAATPPAKSFVGSRHSGCKKWPVCLGRQDCLMTLQVLRFLAFSVSGELFS
jgi:hypothetical protein